MVLWYARSWVGFALFLRFSTFRGRARAVPGRGFSCPPLAELGLVGAELGLVGGCVAADTEGLCVGRAWHGCAVARGWVASGRAESCKCTGFRVPVVPPLAPQRSEVIFLTHIKSFFGFRDSVMIIFSSRPTVISYTVGFISRKRRFSTEAQIGLSYAVEKGLFRLNFFPLRIPTGGSSRKLDFFDWILQSKNSVEKVLHVF